MLALAVLTMLLCQRNSIVNLETEDLHLYMESLNTHAPELESGILAKDTAASLPEWATQVLDNPVMIQAAQSSVDKSSDYVQKVAP